MKNIQVIEKALDEQYEIVEAFGNRPADVAMYEGMLRTVELFRYEWKRKDKKHKLFKL